MKGAALMRRTKTRTTLTNEGHSRYWQWSLTCILWLATTTASAYVDVKLARYPALSHDGQRVAFSWKGDLWVVDAAGGVAQRLTSNPGYDRSPVWSSNSKKIAFVSHRGGGQDVYVMDANGGVPHRLTYHSSPETALFWLPQDKGLVINSPRFAGVSRSYFMFQVGTKGGMPKPYLNVHATSAALSQDGRYIAFVRGSGRWWRKRWKGPYHPTLWLYDTKKKTFKRLTPAGYSANCPSWANNKELIFRSERTGTFNVWKVNVETGQMMPYTHYRKKGIRSVHVSRDGTRVVYSRWDKLYRMELETGLFEEIQIKATGDTAEPSQIRRILQRGIKEYAVSPNQKEVALVLHGNLFLKRFKDPDSWARSIAASPWREKHPSWAPNGRTLAFVSDRQGRRDSIYLVHAGQRKKHPVALFHTLQPKVTRVTAKDATQPETRPHWSPDGKELAFVRGRGQLIVRQMPNGPERVVVKGWNLDTYRWSPDGRWFVFSRVDRESNTDIFLVRSHGRSQPINISRFPDSDISPVWSANGRVLAFLSRGIYNRNGIRYVFLRKSDNEKNPVQLKRSCRRWKKRWKKRMIQRIKMARKHRKKNRIVPKSRRISRRHLQRLPKQPKSRRRPTSRPSQRRKAKEPGRLQQERRSRPQIKRKSRVKIDLKGLPFRLKFIPGLPGGRGASSLAISPSGCTFYVVSRGRGIGGLYEVGLYGKTIRRRAKGRISHVTVSNLGRIHYLNKGMLFAVGNGRKSTRPMRFKAEINIRPHIARLQMFTEGWSWLEQWFYDPKFHGVNWQSMRKMYQSLLPHTYTRRDFDDVVRMMLGELNASHLGIYPPRNKNRPVTGDLGVRFDWRHKGPGLKVLSVRPKGPATRQKSRINPGDIILSVDGNTVSAQNNIHRYLQFTTHRDVVLRVRRQNGAMVTLPIRPVTPRKARTERYQAWIESNRRKLKKWSGGLLAYAHVRAMGIRSLDQFEKDLFAHAYNKKGLILDLRYNGGGWTADLMLTMFFPRPHGYTQWRGSKKGYPVFRRPFYTWHKPVVLLVNERSVSNAEIFAHAFRNLKRGVIVGMPTYGGVISTRNIRLLDGSFFRIPLRGWWTLPKGKNMENGPAQPHVVIPFAPQDELLRKDPQLIRAIQILLKTITKTKEREHRLNKKR